MFDWFRELSAQIPERSGKGRYDIQGLRAFAVVVVILDHLLQWPRGGFVGVDIFFVISGFLITGLLVSEQEKTGRISFVGFYRRRIRRILPAALLVLAVGLGWSWFVFTEARWRETVTDGVWALFFGANWRFQELATDYFNASAPQSPLQHYWSLSIEEQFYFVWPWLMLGVFAVLMRRSGSFVRARVVVFGVIATITAGSFAYALWLTSTNPTSAYFSTLTRAWELGLGATLAVAAPFVAKLPDRLRPALAWVGLGGMVASVFVISNSMAFPAPWAALPVLGTAAVIAAGTFEDRQRQQARLWPLTNRASCYLGDISYSLYLWHFPIIIIGGTLWGDDPVVELMMILGTFVVAAYSYALVEDPLRRSHLLERRHHRRRRKPVYSIREGNIALSFLAIVAVGFSALALQKPEPPQGIVTDLPHFTSAANSKQVDPTPRLTELHREMKKALAATSWPSLQPSMDDAIAGLEAPRDITDCGLDHHVNPQQCTWGDPDAEHHAVTVGNSLSLTYAGAIRAAFGDRHGWSITALGMFGCPFANYAHASASEIAHLPSGCAPRTDEEVTAINEMKPDLIIVAGINAHTAASELRKISSPQSRIVVLPPPPIDKDVRDCYTKGSLPKDCVGRIPSGFGSYEEDFAASVGVEFLPTFDWYCLNGYCPSFVDNIPVKMDNVHMTPEYAEHIGPVVWEAFKVNGIV